MANHLTLVPDEQFNPVFCFQAPLLVGSSFLDRDHLPADKFQVTGKLLILRMLSQELVKMLPLKVVAQSDYLVDNCLLAKKKK